MDSLNVKNINDEKIFNVIDPNGQGEVVNRIRPISVSIAQKVETINDETVSNVTLSVYWNDTWKSILELSFDDSLRQEYGKLVTDLTAIQKDIDMKQYKDAETKTNDFLKYVGNLSSKYTNIPTTQNVAASKNDFVSITANKNSFNVKISDKLLNFMLGKFEKVASMDYTKANECFSVKGNDIDIFFHSPELFKTQAYITVVKDKKVVGSYKATYDQFSKLASKLTLTPQQLGYTKDKMAGYIKTAEVVMQNIFFDSVDEAKEWQEMVDEKKKEEIEPAQEGQEESVEETTTTTTTEEKSETESPVKENGGLARPSEDFASDEIPESQPRQQEQQQGGQMAVSRRLNLLKKRALRKKSYTVEENKKVLKELEDMLKNKDQYYSHETIKKLIKEIKREIELQQSSSKIKNVQKKAGVDITVSTGNVYTLLGMLGKYCLIQPKVIDGKNSNKPSFKLECKPEEVKEVIEKWKDPGYMYEQANKGKNVEKQAKEYKRYNVVVKFNDKEEEYQFENDNEFLALDEALGYFGEKWHELPLANEIEKLEEIKVQELDVDDTVLNEYTKEYFIKNEDKFPKYSCKKQALYGDVQEQDMVPAKTETKVYLQSEKAEDFAWLLNGSGRIEILAPTKLIMGATGSGDNSEGVNELRDYIKKDLEKISVEEMQETVSEYGIDNVKEMDRDELERYLVWLLAGDTADNLENRLADEEEIKNIKAKTTNKMKKSATDYKGEVAELLDEINEPDVLVDYISEDDAKKICKELNIPHEAEWYKGDLRGYIDEIPDGMVDVLIEYISESDAEQIWRQIQHDMGNDIDSSKKIKVKKQAEETVEEKMEKQVGEDGDVKGVIGVGDIVCIKFDNLSEGDFAKYSEFLGVPMLLIENDKEDISKVIIEQVEYPFQRVTINKDNIGLFDNVKDEQVIVEDVDGDEMITNFVELPVVAKQCKIKSIHKAAKLGGK